MRNPYLYGGVVALAFAVAGCTSENLTTTGNAEENDVETSRLHLSTGVQVYAREDDPNSTNELKPRFYVQNGGTTTVSGLQLSYYFTVDGGRTPVLENWYVPGCSTALESLGSGLYRARFTCSGVVLGPGQSWPDTAGCAFGLHYADYSAWYKGDDYSFTGSSSFVASEHILVESGGVVLAGSAPSASPSAPLCGPSLLVMAAETSTSANHSKPRFYVENSGGAAQEGFVLRYSFTVEGSKTPVLDTWYAPGCTAELVNQGSGNYALVCNCQTTTVSPGQAIPDRNGFSFGLHYADWSVWDRSNDYSNPAQSSFVASSTITLHDSSDNLIYGRPANTVVSPVPEPSLAWEQTFGGANADYVYDAFESENGGLVFAGFTNSIGATPGTYHDAWLVKTDALGTVVWQRAFGGASYDVFNSVRPTKDGGLIAAGFSNESPATGQGDDALLVKTDGAGNPTFQRRFGGTNFETVAAVRETADGGFIAVGDAKWGLAGSPETYSDIILLRTDASGNLLWMRSFGQATVWDRGYSVVQSCDGGFAIAGEQGGHGVLLKVDGNGNLAWTQALSQGTAKTVLTTPDNGYLVLGHGPSGAGDSNLWLIKTDANGRKVWTRSYGASTEEQAMDLRPTGTDHFLLLGWQYVPHSGPTYPLTIEVDGFGNTLWSKALGDGSFHVGTAALPIASGGYLAAGYTGGTFSKGWVAKLGNEQTISVTDLPPIMSWCDAACQAAEMPIVYACPQSNPTCTPSRSTTVLFSINGQRIDSFYMPLTVGGAVSANLAVRTIRGSVVASGAGLIASDVPGVLLYSDESIMLTFHDVAPVWGGTTVIDWVGQGVTSSELDSYFFRFPSFDTGDAVLDLLTAGGPVVAQERSIAGVVPERAKAFYLPSELSCIVAEGNLSFGNGMMTINYGFPMAVESRGGFGGSQIHELAHEYQHELFDEVISSYQGNRSCLNEGLADALGTHIGAIPASHLGPISLKGVDFTGNCQLATGSHDIGNCYLWHAQQAGVFSDGFFNAFYHPQHVYNFDSCATSSTVTGNSLVVLFTEANGGVDMASVVSGMNVPNAGSYAAARAALGL